MKTAIPTFYLYGEPHQSVDEAFVHIEAIEDRSRPNEWTIRPHAHADLCHIFVIDSGGGTMRADATKSYFAEPCLLFVPATTVHGFEWSDGTSGSVVTMATRYVADLVRFDTSLGALFNEARRISLQAAEQRRIRASVADLLLEQGWSAPGHRAAVDAAVLSILVLALRSAALHARPVSKPGQHVSTVARFRERIERCFRFRETIATHARALGVSETALRVACARVAGSSPAQLIDERALLEAKRSLLYTNLTISEIAFSIGFSDPAYFSRFFMRNIGISPRTFRETKGR
jgi:AraC family transcriptional activator of pobA